MDFQFQATIPAWSAYPLAIIHLTVGSNNEFLRSSFVILRRAMGIGHKTARRCGLVRRLAQAVAPSVVGAEDLHWAGPVMASFLGREDCGPAAAGCQLNPE